MIEKMEYVKNAIFLTCFLLASIFCSAVAQEKFLQHFCINKTGNYTDGSTYQKNLDNLLSSLPSGIDSYGYSNPTVGEAPDQVNAVVLCRGDVNADSCQDCVNRSIPMLRGLCPTSKDAVGWLDYCMLRYSSQSLTGIQSISEDETFWNYNVEKNTTSPEQFKKDLQTLLEELKPRAVGGGSSIKFASDNRMGPDFQPIYAIVQCTPDLTVELCNSCLTRTFSLYPRCCNDSVGGRVVTPNCNFRYENNSFFNQTNLQTDVPPPPPPPQRPGITRIVAIVVSVSAASVFLVAIFIVWRRWRKSRGTHKSLHEYTDVDMEDMSPDEIMKYEYDDIKAATDDFSEANKLGKGGFGAVYKGKFPNGQEFAVKRLSRSGGQGDAEFKNEVMLVAKLQHRNLVRLLGYSLQGREERLLVYELLTNSSLDHFIFDSNKRTQLDWETRYKIIVGIARGLLYLHEDSRHRIVHRDLKAGNVLLDAEMNPKIADFGMAKLSLMDETHGITRKIAGTYGYMAPEYAMQGEFSMKSDVYSFGVLLLEIISGQKNSSFRSEENEAIDMLSFAWRSWNEGSGLKLIDPTIRNTGELVRDILRCVHIAILCCQYNPVDRPAMASVVIMLTSFSTTLPIPIEPRGLFMERIITNTSSSDVIGSNNGVTISDFNPR